MINSINLAAQTVQKAYQTDRLVITFQRQILLWSICSLCLLVNGCLQCGGDSVEPASDQQKTAGGTPTEEDTSTDLRINDLIVGSGKIAVEGKVLTVHYTGKLKNGVKFDSSHARNKPYSFELGAGKVIPGWELGTQGMRVGGKREITIPPQLAYGESGIAGKIPPNSTLVFVIELLNVE